MSHTMIQYDEAAEMIKYGSGRWRRAEPEEIELAKLGHGIATPYEDYRKEYCGNTDIAEHTNHYD